jgi:hypothetical protein
MTTSSRHRAPEHSARKAGTNLPGKQGRSQRHELAAAAGGVVLLVVIAVLSAWAHHSLSTARPAPPHDAAALPAGAFDPQLPPLPMSMQMRAWLNIAGPSLNALVNAQDDIVAAAAQGDVAGTGAACQAAAGAVANTQQHLPSPDAALNTALQHALTNYRVGIRYCISGTQNQDAEDIGQATAHISQGNTDLQAAVDIVEGDLSSDAREPGVLTV